jgi:hypothetical protein
MEPGAQTKSRWKTVVSGISSVHGQCEVGMSKSYYRVFRRNTPMSKASFAKLLRYFLSAVLSTSNGGN